MLTAMIKKVMNFIRQAQEREDRKGDHLTEKEVTEFEALARDVWLSLGELERSPEAEQLLLHVDVEEMDRPAFVSDLNLPGDWSKVDGAPVFLFCADPWLDHMERLHEWVKQRPKEKRKTSQNKAKGTSAKDLTPMQEKISDTLEAMHEFDQVQVTVGVKGPFKGCDIAKNARVKKVEVTRYFKKFFGSLGQKEYEFICEQGKLAPQLLKNRMPRGAKRLFKVYEEGMGHPSSEKGRRGNAPGNKRDYED